MARKQRIAEMAIVAHDGSAGDSLEARVLLEVFKLNGIVPKPRLRIDFLQTHDIAIEFADDARHTRRIAPPIDAHALMHVVRRHAYAVCITLQGADRTRV